jgi:polyferredoxin
MERQARQTVREDTTPAPTQAWDERTTVSKERRRVPRRRRHDRSQALRHTFQVAFLLLNIAPGVEFFFWVRQTEGSGAIIGAAHPPGVEGWLPIAGLMNLKFWLETGRIPQIHPAAMFLLIAFLSISLLFHKAFCSWLCPIGTVSEFLGRLGRRLFARTFRLPRRLDIPLRGLKYLLLAFFLWVVSSMSAAAIAAFMRSPYGLIADVKMLDFFRYLGPVGLFVIAALLFASLFVRDFWCRYLCPYGALLGLASLASPSRIRRDLEACIDCGKCAPACPASLAVDRLPGIRSSECTACLACAAACPV